MPAPIPITTRRRAPALAGVAAAAAATLIPGGCALPSSGAEAHELAVEVPEEGFAAADPELHPAAAGDGADEDGGPVVLSRWWSRLGDAPLNERLDGLVLRAVAHNRDLRAASARIVAATAQAKIAGAELMPQVDGQFNGSRQRQVFVGIPIPGTGGVASNLNNQFGVSLNLSWELDLWGRIRAGRSAALADVAASAADYAAARESLAAQTVRTFFAAVEANLQMQLAERTATSFRETAEQVRERFERGTRPALDLRLALGNVASAEAQARFRREQLERARRQLELLLGSYPTGAALDEATDLPETLPSIPAGVPSDVLIRRPDLVAAERRLAAADGRLAGAWRSLLPRISLTASGGTTSNQLGDLLDEDFRVWSIGANLVQPLFQGGRLRADVTRNEALVQEAVASWENAVLTAFTEVESALAAERQATSRVEALREFKDQQIAALALAEERYRRGLADFLTVADSQRAALNAESQWLEARRAMLDVRIDLHLALGGGFGPPAGGDAPSLARAADPAMEPSDR